jgi:hypothetical protein
LQRFEMPLIDIEEKSFTTAAKRGGTLDADQRA